MRKLNSLVFQQPVREYASAPAPAKKAVLRKLLKTQKKHEAVQYIREVGMRARLRRRKPKRRKTIGKRLILAWRKVRNRDRADSTQS
jgi:hypothetical protein